MQPPTIRKTDIIEISKLLETFDTVSIIQRTGRDTFRGNLTITLPAYGDCKIAYLSDESFLAVYPENADQFFCIENAVEVRDMTTAEVMRFVTKIAFEKIQAAYSELPV